MNRYFQRSNYVVLISRNGEEILINKKDAKKVLEHTWCVSKTGYAVSRINHKVVKMHRFLLNLTDPKIIIDHKNRNKLDNRRKNIRICTNHQNCMNCSNTKNRKLPIGISMAPNGKYRARIMLDRKEICLGRYTKLRDAILARRTGELKYFCGFRI